MSFLIETSGGILTHSLCECGKASCGVHLDETRLPVQLGFLVLINCDAV